LSSAEIAPEACASLAERLEQIANGLSALPGSVQAANLEDLERQLSVLEDKLFAALTSSAPEDLLIRLKSEAASQLAAYRSRMSVVQLRQIEEQFVHKRLLEHYRLPRLSLFYMRQA
jgi:hypothetical protein